MHLSLPAITALARAGALNRAWAAFAAGGYAARLDDPAALAVKGRLTKDRALLASGAERVALLQEAASAYAAAHAITPAPYLLINVATLTALAGNAAKAASLAQDVLTLLDSTANETPYYLSATRAEALLLCGDLSGAAKAFSAAITADRESWRDHASSIRQFTLIANALGCGTAWLDGLRPPRSLHFVGHMGIASGGKSERALAAAADAIIREQNIGFGYGAIAAGADIILAERIIAAGGELHIILPVSAETFAAQSVARAGTGWLDRYHALLGAAASVSALAAVSDGHEPLATALGGQVAMGAARLNAQTLASKALQLVIVDQDGGGANTAWQAQQWTQTGGKQIQLTIARDDASFPAAHTAAPLDPGRHLCAMLHFAMPETAFSSGALQDQVGRFAGAVGIEGRLFAMPDVNAWLIGFDRIDAALSVAARLRRVGAGTLSGHFGIACRIEDSLSGGTLAYGPDVESCRDLAHSALPGTFTVSYSFAASMALGDYPNWRTEPIGDAEDGTAARFALIAC